MPPVARACVILVAVSFGALSQDRPIRFTHLGTADGLTQSSVVSIAQDREGYMWFGTEDGLNRYNGYEFKAFRNIPGDSASLDNNDVRTVLEDRQGIMWVLTGGGGLATYERSVQAFRRHAIFEQPRRNPDYRAMIVDRRGGLWLATRGEGVVYYNPYSGQVKWFEHQADNPASLRDNAVTSLCEDSTGTIWIGTQSQGLDRYDPEKNRFEHESAWRADRSIPARMSIRSLYVDHRGVLWVGTDAGSLSYYRNATRSFVRYDLRSPVNGSSGSPAVTAIIEDMLGMFWVGTEGTGVKRFDRSRGVFRSFVNDSYSDESLSSNEVRSVYEDRSGVVWVGTYAAGINKYERHAVKFEIYRHNPRDRSSLDADLVRSVFKDAKGTVWVGTDRGLNRMDRRRGEVRHMSFTDRTGVQARPLSIRQIADGGSGFLWLGTNDGLLRVNTRTGAAETFRNERNNRWSLGGNFINALHTDDDGSLWVGTSENGVDHFNPGTGRFVHYRRNDTDRRTLSSDQVLALFTTSGGALWVGTRDGLNRFDRSTGLWQRYGDAGDARFRLSNPRVSCGVEDHSGKLWVGTWGGGLNRLDTAGKSFMPFTMSDGLPNDFIYSIQSDSHRNLWVSTNRGLSQFEPTTLSCRNYGIEDGLQSDEFDAGAFFKSRSGELFFGGVGGLNSFYPDSIRFNPYVPPVVISEFRIFDRIVPIQNGLVELTPNENFFSFEFAALNFTVSKNNQYAYTMEGFDRSWVMCGTRRFANYTNLNAGTYTFRVKASNNDGLWNEEGESVTIVVRPPVWTAWWFRSFIGIALLILAWFAYFRHVTRLVRDKEVQEEFAHQLIASQENERKRIAGELHDSVGQDILIIKNKALMGLSERSKPEALERQLEEISSFASQTLDDVRKISQNLRPVLLDKVGLTETVKQLVETVGAASKIKIEVSIDNVDEVFTREAEINFFRIVQESLNNILKHSEAQAATIEIIRELQAVHLIVEDDGRGFELAPSSEHASHTEGLGLAGIAERARIMGGELTLTSSPGVGTKIYAKIPLIEHRDGS